METLCWVWSFDKRWVFNQTPKRMDKIWCIPLIINALLLGFIIHVFFLDVLSTPSCAQLSGHKLWLQTQAVLLTIDILLILALFYKVTRIHNKKEEQLKGFNSKLSTNPKKFGYWIQQKGLLSVIGFGVLLMSLLLIVWAILGLVRFFSNGEFKWCSYELKITMLANILVPLVSLSPIIFTFIIGAIVKLSFLAILNFFPSLFIAIKKFTRHYC